MFRLIVLLVYLGPVIYFFGTTALKLVLASIYDCEISARGVSPCIIAGRDFGEFISSGAMAGFAFALFVIPWLLIGGLVAMLLLWVDRKY